MNADKTLPAAFDPARRARWSPGDLSPGDVDRLMHVASAARDAIIADLRDAAGIAQIHAMIWAPSPGRLHAWR